MSYAIIESGSKQYRVQKDDVIEVELMEDVQEDKPVTFNRVMLFSNGNATQVGAPFVEGCKVVGEFVQEVKGPKVVAYKYKQRKNYRRKVGHRQRYCRIKITEIQG